ncbi:hypothetical protein J1N35_043926 [Gossypium stocksii]|uniref:Uncharacterized protein n=1 Tax=Gossypium stocksii TaxID=47602 RepID=A0A9D3U8A4_9ROSI|nr:hypothetical protein J1N35_043926 [Gossypium stocksii]
MSSSNFVYISFVYGSLNRQKRKDLWDMLRRSFPVGNFPWDTIGDFNAILSSSEKLGGMAQSRRCPFFGKFVDKAELHDLGYKGPFLLGIGVCFLKGLRALGNDAWVQQFPNSLVTHLLKIKSDHRTLLLSLNLEKMLPRGRPFRFLAGWVEHPDFGKLVDDNWGYSSDMSDTLSTLSRGLKDWNKSIYGHITSRKKFLVKELTRIQKLIDFLGSNRLAKVELKIRQELENILRHEELLWKQKAYCDWLILGDRNTKFFHARTLRQIKNNHITTICNDCRD